MSPSGPPAGPLVALSLVDTARVVDAGPALRRFRRARAGRPYKTERRFLDFAVDGRPLYGTSQVAGHDRITGLCPDWVDGGVATLKMLLGDADPDAPGGRTVLYMCAECGDLACGAITARVTFGDDVVTWTEWSYQDRDYQDSLGTDGFSDLSFDTNQYRLVLTAALDELRP